jgi:hypothetical protein
LLLGRTLAHYDNHRQDSFARLLAPKNEKSLGIRAGPEASWFVVGYCFGLQTISGPATSRAKVKPGIAGPKPIHSCNPRLIPSRGNISSITIFAEIAEKARGESERFPLSLRDGSSAEFVGEIRAVRTRKRSTWHPGCAPLSGKNREQRRGII